MMLLVTLPVWVHVTFGDLCCSTNVTKFHKILIKNYSTKRADDVGVMYGQTGVTLNGQTIVMVVKSSKPVVNPSFLMFKYSKSWQFNINEQEQFHAQLSWGYKMFNKPWP